MELRCLKFANSVRLFNHSSHRLLSRCHYDVLGVERNCSHKEIRSAFFELSKKYHPDVNHGKISDQRFIELKEAYEILGKPSSRHRYDLFNSNPLANSPEYKYHRYESPGYSVHSTRSEFYTQHLNREKVSHVKIVIACIIFITFGAICHGFAFKYVKKWHHETVTKKHLENYRVYQEVREKAKIHGHERMINILKEHDARLKEKKNIHSD